MFAFQLYADFLESVTCHASQTAQPKDLDWTRLLEMMELSNLNLLNARRFEIFSLRAGSLVWGLCATILAALAAICESASEASRREEWGE